MEDIIRPTDCNSVVRMIFAVSSDGWTRVLPVSLIERAERERLKEEEVQGKHLSEAIAKADEI